MAFSVDRRKNRACIQAKISEKVCPPGLIFCNMHKYEGNDRQPVDRCPVLVYNNHSVCVRIQFHRGWNCAHGTQGLISAFGRYGGRLASRRSVVSVYARLDSCVRFMKHDRTGEGNPAYGPGSLCCPEVSGTPLFSGLCPILPNMLLEQNLDFHAAAWQRMHGYIHRRAVHLDRIRQTASALVK